MKAVFLILNFIAATMVAGMPSRAPGTEAIYPSGYKHVPALEDVETAATPDVN